MKKLLRKEIKLREAVNKFELKRLYLKSLLMDQNLPKNIRHKFQMELDSLPKKSIKNRLNNRCTLTGRGHGVFSFLKMSRIMIKNMALDGDIPGLKKTSW